MQLNLRNKKIYFTRTLDYLRPALVLSLLIGGILFFSHPAIIRLAASQSNPEGEACEVKGIFYEEENPRVLINDDLLSIGDYCCGARISGIFAESIALEFPSGRKEYRLGAVFSKEKAAVKTVTASQAPAPKTQPPYLTTLNSLVDSLMNSQSQHSIALNLPIKESLFADPDEATQIRVRANRMLELIEEKKKEFARFSVPNNAKRLSYLTIKLFDIAEEGWKAVLADNKDKAEVFFGRLSRIAQEIALESISLLSRQ